VPLAIPETLSASVLFKTRRTDVLAAYRGRVVIDWGDGTRVWVQRALTPAQADHRDPARAARARISGLRAIPSSPGSDRTGATLMAGRTVERTGIYLLVYRENGQQYVGSAYGLGGFFGR